MSMVQVRGSVMGDPWPARLGLPTPMVYEPSGRKTWEYKVLSREGADSVDLVETELQELGADGWLLVGIVVTQDRARAVYYLVREA